MKPNTQLQLRHATYASPQIDIDAQGTHCLDYFELYSLCGLWSFCGGMVPWVSPLDLDFWTRQLVNTISGRILNWCVACFEISTGAEGY